MRESILLFMLFTPVGGAGDGCLGPANRNAVGRSAAEGKHPPTPAQRRPVDVGLAQGNDEAHAAFEVIKSYRDKDLEKEGRNSQSKLLKSITTLFPARTYDVPWGFRPRHVWRFDKEAQPPIHVLFEVDDSGPHPGSTILRITMFENSGKVRSETVFTTGRRCYLRKVSLEVTSARQYPLLHLKTGEGGGPGPDFEDQYYALIGNRVDLVRVAGPDGKATRNLFYVKDFSCGPSIPNQSEREWESDLTSKDRLRVLRALVWLGGVHRASPVAAAVKRGEEDHKDVLLVRKVRGRKNVIVLLKNLAASKDLWEREAAQLALDPKDDSF